MNRALQLLKNKYTKYLLTGGFFAIWMGYFDRNDLYTQLQRQRELEATQGYIAQLRTEIADMKAQKEGIEQDPKVLEKFARENYRLKRDNEDIYVFE